MIGGYKMSVRKMVAGFAAATMLFAVAGAARAGVLDELGRFGVKADSAAPAQAASVPLVTSAITPFGGRGTGVISLAGSHAGVCSDSVVACNVTTCECDALIGTVTVSKLGSSTLSLNITTSDSTSYANGISSCFPGTGHGTICHGV